MPPHFSRQSRRHFTSPLLLLGALAGAACGSTDGAMLLRPAAGSGGGSEGGSGGTSGGSAGTSTSGSGGAREPRDGGADAMSDASPVAPPPACGLPPDAGAVVDAGADAASLDGGPYECILAP